MFHFSRSFASQTVISNVFRHPSSVFAPELFAVLRPGIPPTTAWYETLLSHILLQIWVVSLVVLECVGCSLYVFGALGMSSPVLS
jgi:hypothetical protein